MGRLIQDSKLKIDLLSLVRKKVAKIEPLWSRLSSLEVEPYFAPSTGNSCKGEGDRIKRDKGKRNILDKDLLFTVINLT